MQQHASFTEVSKNYGSVVNLLIINLTLTCNFPNVSIHLFFHHLPERKFFLCPCPAHQVFVAHKPKEPVLNQTLASAEMKFIILVSTLFWIFGRCWCISSSHSVVNNRPPKTRRIKNRGTGAPKKRKEKSKFKIVMSLLSDLPEVGGK